MAGPCVRFIINQNVFNLLSRINDMVLLRLQADAFGDDYCSVSSKEALDFEVLKRSSALYKTHHYLMYCS